jgi:lipoate-protein ligase A
MATDEALLHSAAAGRATLRFYSWSPPTLSLGYFQSEKLRHTDPLLAALPFVRRPSGGATLVHHHEVTYALALPSGPWQQGEPWPRRMHRIIVDALATLGVEGELYHPTGSEVNEVPLCFHHFAAGDVLVGRAKVVGSAQRKHRGAILQHGGILLARSEYTPSLPGIRELKGVDIAPEQVAAAVIKRWQSQGLSDVENEGLSDVETHEIKGLITHKYAAPEWNARR